MIRRADPSRDAAACAAIYAPYVTGGAISFEDIPPSTDEFAERISRITRTHPWFVEEQAGAVVGYAYASEHRERAAYRWAVDVAVYVDADHHRQGVGRRLYDVLFTELRAQGFRAACAGITLPNDASVGLHEALGFVPVGVYRNIGWKAGTWWDVGWWQLDFSPQSVDAPAEPSTPTP